jgi:hypothetical protein
MDESAGVCGSAPVMGFRWIASFDAVMLVYVLVAFAFAGLYGLRIDYAAVLAWDYHVLFLALLLACAWLGAVVVALRELCAGRDRVPFGPSWRSIVRRRITAQTMWDVAKLLVLIKLMFVLHGTIKQAIPLINPRLFDEELYVVDRIAHLGIDPIAATHAVFRTEAMMRAIDWLYVSWYTLLPPVLATFMLAERRLRAAFFSAFFLIWMLGGLAAVAVPSLGPIYVDPATFAEITMPQARELQERLWVHYERVQEHPESYQVVLYEGVAAFPSKHVGVVALFACFLFHVSRWAGWAMVAYTAIIQIGSVQLGWHYAVDGYAGILLAAGLWWACTRHLESPPWSSAVFPPEPPP